MVTLPPSAGGAVPLIVGSGALVSSPGAVRAKTPVAVGAMEDGCRCGEAVLGSLGFGGWW